MKVGPGKQESNYNTKSQAAGKHSVSHMQTSGNTKAFRGYANVVTAKDASP